MSILSQLLDGKLTFDQAVQQGAQWFDAILAKAPAEVQADVTDALSSFKQAASNAIMLADTDLGPILSVATTAVQTAADAAMVKATGGLALPLTPLVNSGIQQVAAALKAEIDASAAKASAALAANPSPPAVGVSTSQAGVSTSLGT